MKSTHPNESAFARAVRRDGEEWLEPLESAQATWHPDQLQGPATTGLLGRALEREAAALRPEFVPGRASFQMMRAVLKRLSKVRVEVVRNGPRILVLDAFLEQEGDVVARAHAFFLRPGPDPEGAIWDPDHQLSWPDDGVDTDPHGRSYRSEGTAWAGDPATVASPNRKFVWQRSINVVEGETSTPFQLMAMASDLANMVSHWSEHGVQFINADASMAIGRLPRGDGVGLATLSRAADGGVSAGAAVMYDRDGPLGVVNVSAIAQTRVRVDFVPGGFSTRQLSGSG